MTKVFQDVTKGTTPFDLYYVWSAAANWVGGVAPVNGDDVAYTAVFVNSDEQVDNIVGLSLNTLQLAAGALSLETLYVSADLTIGTLTLTRVGPQTAMLEATDTFGANPVVKINALSGNGGTLFAFGGGARIDDNAAADPGGFTYASGNGGVIYLKSAPAPTSTLTFYDASGVIELANPGATISAALTGVQTGARLELPGVRIANVLYGANAITVVTDVAAYTFSKVAYASGALGAATGFYGARDAATGLERVVFDTAEFDNAAAQQIGPFAGDYLYSDPSSWAGGVVPNCGKVLLNPTGSSAVTFLFDEANLRLASLSQTSLVVASQIVVNGGLTIGDLSTLFVGTISADTTIVGGAAVSTLTVLNSMQTHGADIKANGVGATVNVDFADSGQFYFADNGGRIQFASSVSSTSELSVGASGVGTVVFRDPGATIGAALAIYGAGDSFELPGSAAVSASLALSQTFTITTSAGGYAFSSFNNLSGGPLLGLKASRDASTGLEKFTFETNADVLSVNASGAGVVKGTGVVGAGASLSFKVGMSGAVTVDKTFGNPRLALSDGGFATYSGGSGTNMLTFTYIVGAGQNSSDLTVIGFGLNGGTILDAANDPADMSALIANPSGTLRVFTNPNHFRADFNDDKTSDLLWYNKTTGGYYDSLVAGGVAGAKIGIGALAPAAGWKLAGIGDFNGDGSSDLLFRNASTGAFIDWDVKAGKLLASHVIGAPAPATGWTIAAVGDFNNDGTSDILFRNNSSGALSDWAMLNDRHVATRAVAASLASAWSVAGAGDFNGDGSSDLLLVNTSTRAMQDWRMGGGVRTGVFGLGFAPAGTTFCGAGDFNKDGSDDLVFAASNGALTLVTMTGGARGATSSLGKAMPGGFTYAAVGDFNGDGRADLLAYNATTGALDLGLTGANNQILAWTALGALQVPTTWRFAA